MTVSIVLSTTSALHPIGLPRTQSRIVRSDEFDGTRGSTPDPSKWGHDRGGEGWGNDELQYYTDQGENAALDGNSCLVITARCLSDADALPLPCWYGPCRYTSARLLTAGRFSFQYGLVAARIKVPYGRGLWPAFWMLGENFAKTGWPACGEIDIMENIGREPGIVHGTVHAPGYSGTEGIGGLWALPDGRQWKDDFHIFAVRWQPRRICWYVDNHLFFQVKRADLTPGSPWPFNQPFFLLLNVAVGGKWPGPPDATSVFPQVMLIDYVRVYQAR